MTFKVLVTITVVNEDNEVVDHNGYVNYKKRPFSPLSTTQELSEYKAIENAHAQLNSFFNVVKAISNLD